jgi:hypothetical protein
LEFRLTETSQTSGQYRLVCSDPGMRRALTRWLEGSKIPWSDELVCVAHVVSELPAYKDDRPLFPQGHLTVQAGPSDNTVRISMSEPPALAVVHPTEPRVDMWLTPTFLSYFESAERHFLLLVLTFLLRRVGLYHVHGAALVDPSGEGWLLAGNSRSGKSTTTALLASQGWRIASDDICFLVNSVASVGAIGYRAPVALRSGGVRLLKLDGGELLRQRRKLALSPEELGGAWIQGNTPRYLLFPTVGEATSVAPITPVQAIAEIIKWSIWVLIEPFGAEEHLGQLTRLANQCQSFAVTLGPDLFHNPALLQTLVHGHTLSQAS